tara:strand:- start:3369 stop:4274 length:906 start_codon:yes stop_codon:yes gene_type:complete
MNKKFIAFGCKNSNSTNSHIYYAYLRAFESLGWESYWVDNEDVDNFDFSNSLIFTFGGYDQKIPIRKDCKYILHNCDLNKYNDVSDNSLILQVFTTDVYGRDVEKIDDFIYYQKNGNVLYQPWATDLLPHEIIEKTSLNFTYNKEVYWVGSIWNTNGEGNTVLIAELVNSLSKRGIKFQPIKTVLYDNSPYIASNFYKTKEIINNSYISPSLQGNWQCDKGYIACRIFKNISYGEFGITNSKYVNSLFQDMIVYDSDIDLMVEKALEKRNTITLEELNQQIRFVKQKHTYINRINNILSIL